MPEAAPRDITAPADIRDVIRNYWGFDELRPLQAEAIRAGLGGRDSLVVLPTGGGKSLCYQVPPAVAGRTDLVVSPLISLMKDQVDGLRQCGYPAAALHSGVAFDEVRETGRALRRGEVRLLYVSPERLLTPGCLTMLSEVEIGAIAIDEAHCISHWGHDFRPEYRRLAELRRHFPQAALHGFTATATQQVRDDIVRQLQLREPAVLVGDFDRPNLVYRVVPRLDAYSQVLEIVRRHQKRAVIVYCVTRRETESMAGALQAARVRAEPYHAGLSPAQRRRTQEAFQREKLDVVVATVAFGMGIDRSDVRCVVHAGLPKSLEHYQQEAGRAGRDGLEAECVLLYSPADVMKWESLLARSAEESGAGDEVFRAGMRLLEQMRKYATAIACRHKLLVEHFGQPHDKDACGACDVCLGEVRGAFDGTVIAQKILSCVARTGERFGVTHIVDVLRGADTERVRKFGHERLSTYGLCQDTDRKALTNLVYQVLDQGLVRRSGDDKPVLQLNEESWAVMRGQRVVTLREAQVKEVKRSKVDAESWRGVDRPLFEQLRGLRRTIAEGRGVPPYVVFGDATLRDLARIRPTSDEVFLRAHGVGKKKLRDFGPPFLAEIRRYCSVNALAVDVE